MTTIANASAYGNAGPLRAIRLAGLGAMLASSMMLAACTTTTSGSQRLDETGNQLAENGVTLDSQDETPATAAQVLAALRGGLVGRMPGLTLTRGDRNRALEAEYKALEDLPSGQTSAWSGSAGLRGQVMAAAPYQVGAQNCRQYSHVVTLSNGQTLNQRGAACRNPNGSWTPLD